jgi:hypothetical protein
MGNIIRMMFLVIISSVFIITAETVAGGSTKKDQSPKKGTTADTGPVINKVQSGNSDTLIVKARLIEIPGTFPPNDLYNYVYIMKYQIVSVEKGQYKGKEILVGEYNPAIPRSQVKDKMDKVVDGNVTKFETGSIHRLVLLKSIDMVWKDAIEDSYFDSDLNKYYALKTDNTK